MGKYVITKQDEMLMWIVKRKYYNLFQLRDAINVAYTNAWGFSRKLERMGFVKSLGKGKRYKVFVRCEDGKISQ